MVPHIEKWAKPEAEAFWTEHNLSKAIDDFSSFAVEAASGKFIANMTDDWSKTQSEIAEIRQLVKEAFPSYCEGKTGEETEELLQAFLSRFV